MTTDPLLRWNSRFAEPGYLFGTAPNRFLESQRQRFRPGMTALAVADGEGRNGVWMARQGLAVTAVDFSPVALAKARALAQSAGVMLVTHQADLATWAWPVDTFDVVAAIFIQFADPPLRARLFEAMKRALKPGGLLILQGYRPEQLTYRTGGPPDIDQLYTRPMLEEAFAGFEMLHLAEHDSAIEEGSGHRGMSALIDLVARKPG